MEKIATSKCWAVDDIHDLLNPAPLKLEMGLSRLASGELLVAVRTDMHGCKGEMLDWWFRYFDSTQKIKWWHPHDHVAFKGWDEKWVKGENYIGATIEAVESLADIPPVAAKLKFHAPTDFFELTAYEKAQDNNWVSAAICSTIGFGEDIVVDAEGDPVSGEMVHLARDTEFGCVLRSRFLLGKPEPDKKIEVSDEIGLNLMRHCYNEFTYLSRILPSLYFAEAKPEAAPTPW